MNFLSSYNDFEAVSLLPMIIDEVSFLSLRNFIASSNFLFVYNNGNLKNEMYTYIPVALKRLMHPSLPYTSHAFNICSIYLQVVLRNTV